MRDDDNDKQLSVIVTASSRRERTSLVSGSSVEVIVDGALAGADMYGGVNTLAPGARIPLHWHSVGELQYLLNGEGVLLRPDIPDARVRTGDCIFSPAGADAAHGYRNDGATPLVILFFYPSVDGQTPDTTFCDD